MFERLSNAMFTLTLDNYIYIAAVLSILVDNEQVFISSHFKKAGFIMVHILSCTLLALVLDML